MSSSSSHVRHGVYLPVELLNQLRIVAASEKKSINKQIETIIREWLAKEKKSIKLSRDDLLQLPPEVRESILHLQAKKMKDYYKNNDEFAGSEADLYEY
ncbi:MAG: hypothetical protein ACQETH_10140 [Candidatus Rifleibacteriota bacterium]